MDRGIYAKGMKPQYTNVNQGESEYRQWGAGIESYDFQMCSKIGEYAVNYSHNLQQLLSAHVGSYFYSILIGSLSYKLPGRKGYTKSKHCYFM